MSATRYEAAEGDVVRATKGTTTLQGRIVNGEIDGSFGVWFLQERGYTIEKIGTVTKPVDTTQITVHSPHGDMPTRLRMVADDLEEGLTEASPGGSYSFVLGDDVRLTPDTVRAWLSALDTASLTYSALTDVIRSMRSLLADYDNESEND